jgi:hypothetical protein
MQKNYLNYSDVVGFDLTFNLEQNGRKNGSITSVAINGSIQILGIAVIKHQTKENYKKLFQFI